MFATLGLGVIETAINRLFIDLNDSDKALLTGKALRISVGLGVLSPLVADVVFDVDKVRFEPVCASLPDCTLGCESPKALIMHLTGTDIGSVSGDTAIIDHIRHIITSHPPSRALIDRLYPYL